jgi:predicted ribosomally synthesized peptide with nif11-like leader
MAQVQQDEGLRQELRAAGGKAGMPVDAVVAFAAGKGYQFKVEDVSTELTDANLDHVAGGGAQPQMNTFLKLDGMHKIDGLSTYLSSAGKLMYKFF